MLQHERERLLYRILSGRTKLKNLRLDVKAPSLDLLYESEEIYCDYYEKKNVLTKDEIRKFLVSQKIISQEDLNFLTGCVTTIKNLQKELCANFETPHADGIRSLIKQARLKQEKIFETLAPYETYSRESLAYYCKSIFLIINTTYYNNSLYNFEKKTPQTVLAELSKLSISVDEIREIARESSWANIWFGTKGNFLDTIPTSELQLLFIWSKIYDNIRESTDCPSEDLISDNDAIDGWLLLREEEHNKKKAENSKKLKSNSKIANADEVFFIARNKEDVERIQRMNSAQSKRIQQERMAQIYDKKAVDHHNLLDVRRDIQMKFHKLQMENIKHGNKN